MIRANAEGRTVLLITHRLASVRHADYIYVLDHGRVVERGSHERLIANAGLYADLYTLQASAYDQAADELPDRVQRPDQVHGITFHRDLAAQLISRHGLHVGDIPETTKVREPHSALRHPQLPRTGSDLLLRNLERDGRSSTPGLGRLPRGGRPYCL